MLSLVDIDIGSYRHRWHIWLDHRYLDADTHSRLCHTHNTTLTVNNGPWITDRVICWITITLLILMKFGAILIHRSSFMIKNRNRSRRQLSTAAILEISLMVHILTICATFGACVGRKLGPWGLCGMFNVLWQIVTNAYVLRTAATSVESIQNDKFDKLKPICSGACDSLRPVFNKLRTTKFGLKKLETSLYRMVLTNLQTIISFCQGARGRRTDGRTDRCRQQES